MGKGCQYGHVTLIGCPKLDTIDYSEKLTQILSGNQIDKITVGRMEVPCCGGMLQAVKRVIHDCGKNCDYDMRRLWDADEDVSSLKLLICCGICSVAVCACRAAALK